MIVRVVPSIHRPWKHVGGYYSCDYFPETRFTELSPRAEVGRIRDAKGRWHRVRGVRTFLDQAEECPAQAVRCQDPTGIEGYLVIGGELGVIMYGVGDAGMGSPIVWVEELKDFPPAAAAIQAQPLAPEAQQRAETGGIIDLSAIRVHTPQAPDGHEPPAPPPDGPPSAGPSGLVGPSGEPV